MLINTLHLPMILFLILIVGCTASHTPAPSDDLPRSTPIPTPQDAPAEPTFKPDVPPRFIRDDRPLQPSACLMQPVMRAVVSLRGVMPTDLLTVASIA
jgi:hypothetical protein